MNNLPLSPTYWQGLLLYKQQKWAAAGKKFTEVLAKQPNNAAANFKLGMCHLKQKQWIRASRFINQAIELSPQKQGWRVQQDRANKERIKSELAKLKESKLSAAQKEEQIRHWIGQDNNNPQLHNELAHTLRKQGKWWQEVEALTFATSLEGRYPTWFYRLGEALEAMNRFQQAAKAYGQSIALKNGKAEALWHYRQGHCFEREGHDGPANPSAAKKAYAQAIAQDTQLKAKRFGIGVFHQARGLWPQAQQAYAQQQMQAPWDAELCYRLGMTHDRCYEWAKAEQAYRLALALDINQIYWHYRLGFVLERQQKYQDAAIAYEYAAKNRAIHTPYWFYRWGYVLEQAGQYEQACQAYLQTRTQQTLDPVELDPVELDPILVQYKAQLNNQEAIATTLEKVLEQDTTNPETWFKLGNVYERMQKWDVAAEAYQNAQVNKIQSDSDCLFRLGYVLSQTKKDKAACEILSKMDFLRGFKNRIALECQIEVIKLEFESEVYTLTATVQNKSKLNDLAFVECFYLKHRERIGNEVDEHPLNSRRLLGEGSVVYEFDINAKDLQLSMHYWDLWARLNVADKVYGDVDVPLQINRFAPSVVAQVDANPWVLATRDEETIFHPYCTVGGRKIAFLKRPIIEYDDPIYIQREQQALSEYYENKEELENRKAWLVYEKFSKTAQDNGFYFFKYAVKQRPHVYYVIEKDSPDRQYLEDYEDNVVEFMSIEHIKLILSCELMIGSEAKSHCYAFRRIGGVLKSRLLQKKFIFLQHGVIGLKRIDSYFKKTNKQFKPAKFICSNAIEKEIIMTNFGYDEDDMVLSGLPRWDGLVDVSAQHSELFLMPTWRNWLEDMSDDEFVKTDYFKYYLRLLASAELSEFLKQSNLVLNFYLHPKVIAHIGEFEVRNDHIKIIDFGECTIRELLQRAKLLITDYSSIAWDFVYLGKPVVFYHFDLEQYEKYQGAYIDLKTELPGRFAYDQDELINILKDSLAHFSEEKLKAEKNSNNYFPRIHGSIAEKIYTELVKDNA